MLSVRFISGVIGFVLLDFISSTHGIFCESTDPLYPNRTCSFYEKCCGTYNNECCYSPYRDRSWAHPLFIGSIGNTMEKPSIPVKAINIPIESKSFKTPRGSGKAVKGGFAGLFAMFFLCCRCCKKDDGDESTNPEATADQQQPMNPPPLQEPLDPPPPYSVIIPLPYHPLNPTSA